MIIKFSLASLFIASLIATNAYAVTTTGTCDGQRTSYAADNAIASTFSETYVNVPGMVRTITIPGTTSTCVAINFSASAFLNTGFAIVVRATLDGVACPGSVQLDGGPDDSYNSYASGFICPNVTPGNHTFRIQWFSPENFTVSMSQRSMIIHHR